VTTHPPPEPATAAEPGLPGRLREARANDAAVLKAAREVFARRGPDASIADIAKLAGVGVGSIYRRYATKEDLVEALHVHGVLAAAAMADEIADTGPIDDTGAVGTFIARQIREIDGPPLQPSGAQSGLLPEALAEASERLGGALRRLVDLDLAARLIPEGFTTADAMQLMLHVRPRLPLPPADARALHLRYLSFALAGLRAHAGLGTPVAPGPRWEEWVRAWHE